jgi:formylmethanofuran dehydrogenase subunit E
MPFGYPDGEFAKCADYDTVPPEWGCPNCGETMMDNLAWDNDGEIITCATCSNHYAIAE